MNWYGAVAYKAKISATAHCRIKTEHKYLQLLRTHLLPVYADMCRRAPNGTIRPVGSQRFRDTCRVKTTMRHASAVCVCMKVVRLKKGRLNHQVESAWGDVRHH